MRSVNRSDTVFRGETRSSLKCDSKSGEACRCYGGEFNDRGGGYSAEVFAFLFRLDALTSSGSFECPAKIWATSGVCYLNALKPLMNILCSQSISPSVRMPQESRIRAVCPVEQLTLLFYRLSAHRSYQLEPVDSELSKLEWNEQVLIKHEGFISIEPWYPVYKTELIGT